MGTCWCIQCIWGATGVPVHAQATRRPFRPWSTTRGVVATPQELVLLLESIARQYGPIVSGCTAPTRKMSPVNGGIGAGQQSSSLHPPPLYFVIACRPHADHMPIIHADRTPIRVAHGLRTVCGRFAHGLRTVCARFAHGLRTACARLADGLRTVCARLAHGLRTVCARSFPCTGCLKKHLLRQFCSRWRPNDPHGLIGRQKISPPKCIVGPTVVWE